MVSRMRNLLRIALAPVLAAGSLLMITAGPASADNVWWWENRQSRFCLDDSVDFGLRTFPCNGLDYQKWNSHYWIQDGTYEIRNIATRRCLGAKILNGGTGILVTFIATCDTSRAQSWYVTATPDRASFTFFNQDVGHYLTDIGGDKAGGHYVGMTAMPPPSYPADRLWY